MQQRRCTLWELNYMDILNTFFVFNIAASVATLLAFFLTRDTVTDRFHVLKDTLRGLNVAGAAGAVTSMALLTSVAHLFR
jgi:hypothetical protein